ncbi:hypothetical protein HY249_02875 [Candidatus Azambacteria bacterium]|nr:hypothetical protein [Candidatus Azambacteria bacterium]
MQREQKSDIVNDLLANQGRSNLSDEVLRSIKPPEDAKSIKLSNDLLNSIAPPTGTKPIEIQQSVIDSIAPQASQ